PLPRRTTSPMAVGSERYSHFTSQRHFQVQSPSDIRDISRPPRAQCDALAQIGTATASSELSLMGIRDAQIQGPRPLKTGRSVAGPALTLQMMPKREDLYGANEYDNPEVQLHRH